MKYLLIALCALAAAGCADHHTMTACQGPFMALSQQAVK